MCKLVLGALVKADFLCVNSNGSYDGTPRELDSESERP